MATGTRLTTTEPKQAQKIASLDYLRDLGYSDFSMEVNDQCNFHCIYCPYDTDKNHEFATLDQSKAMEIIDQLADDGSLDRYLLFNILGEPFMYKGLFDLIKYAGSRGLKTKIVTNGSLLTKRNIEAIIEANPTMLKISVESLDAQVFPQLRGTTIEFEKWAERVTNMISAAFQAGPKFTTYLQLDLIYSDHSRYSLDRMCGLVTSDPGRQYLYEQKSQLAEAVRALLEAMVDVGSLPGKSKADLKFDTRQIVFENNDAPLVKISPNIAFHVKSYLRWDDIFSRRYPVANSGRGCGIDNLAVHADGRVVLCCIDYNASTTIGNIFERSLQEIMTDPENVKIIQDLRRGVFHFDACKSCQGHSTFLGKTVYGAWRQKTVHRVSTALRTKLKVLRGVKLNPDGQEK